MSQLEIRPAPTHLSLVHQLAFPSVKEKEPLVTGRGTPKIAPRKTLVIVILRQVMVLSLVVIMVAVMVVVAMTVIMTTSSEGNGWQYKL